MLVKLLNVKATKALILRRCQYLRPGWRFTRVSSEALDAADQALRRWLDKQIATLPSNGHTVKFDHRD